MEDSQLSTTGWSTPSWLGIDALVAHFASHKRRRRHRGALESRDILLVLVFLFRLMFTESTSGVVAAR